MCKVLKIARSTYYYISQFKKREKRIAREKELNDAVTLVFKQSRESYGTRKIKAALAQQSIQISRRKIGKIMKQLNLVSVYTKAKYKNYTKPNEKDVPNVLNRSFKFKKKMEVLVSDLTYVRVGTQWRYICLFVDLFNREIVGFSVGTRKDAHLVFQALSSIKYNLSNVQIFHTDRGKEFDNKLIDDALQAFGIQRSLSMKGCPYDNAVAEATFKIIKSEFVSQYTFETIESLRLELFDYINWFNHHRLHSTLGYQTPINYEKIDADKMS